MSTKWIVVDGPHRTGSTMAYNLVRMSLEVADRGVSLGLLEPWICDRLCAVAPARPAVLKVHHWIVPESPESCLLTATLRNPFDTAYSLLRHPEKGSGVLWSYMENARVFYDAMASKCVLLDYDLWYADRMNQSRLFLEKCGIEPLDLDRIVDECSPERAKSIADGLESGDREPVTEVRHKHVSDSMGRPGAWEGNLDEEAIRRIEESCGSWLRLCSYQRRA